MQTVETLILKLDSLPGFVQQSGNSSIEENKDDILDLNKAQMIVLGVDSDNSKLGEYAPLSVQERKKKGLQTDYIDLRFTGDFQDSMTVKKEGKGFAIDATDGKWDGNEISPTLSQQFPDALGLTPENENTVTEIIINKIDKEVDKYLSTSTPPGIKSFANV